MAELTPKEAAEILGVARNTVRLWQSPVACRAESPLVGTGASNEHVVRQWADLRREPSEPADHYLAGWRRCADAMLNAAVKDLGPGTEAAAPFRAALIALRGRDSV